MKQANSQSASNDAASGPNVGRLASICLPHFARAERVLATDALHAADVAAVERPLPTANRVALMP
jgi:hypothetical protein